MARGRESKKITAYRRYSWVNIGTGLFAGIFLYMIICLIIYLTARHTTPYEVISGSISGNYRYSALALKHETVVTSDTSGYISYYAREGTRTASGSTVCSVDRTQHETVASQSIELLPEDYDFFRMSLASFSQNFNPGSFQEVYAVKADLESILLRSGTDEAQLTGSSVSVFKMPASGFICYTIDGMETLNEQDLCLDDFQKTRYQAQNLRFQDSVKTGDPVFKLITGEDWCLYFPVSAQMATDLGGKTSMRFRFLKDDTTFQAPFSVIHTADGHYGKISLTNSLVRYVPDRFLEIELLMDRAYGLKIPSSAIGEKAFYKISSEYVIENKDNPAEITLIRESFGNDGSSNVRYITATVYDKQGEDYLVDTSLFNDGDYVLKADTNKKHQMVEEDLVKIQGVYNINQGYAIFRQVTVIDQNEEFCVVAPNNPYGLAAHDYIALDASSVKDDTII